MSFPRSSQRHRSPLLTTDSARDGIHYQQGDTLTSSTEHFTVLIIMLHTLDQEPTRRLCRCQSLANPMFWPLQWWRKDKKGGGQPSLSFVSQILRHVRRAEDGQVCNGNGGCCPLFFRFFFTFFLSLPALFVSIPTSNHGKPRQILLSSSNPSRNRSSRRVSPLSNNPSRLVLVVSFAALLHKTAATSHVCSITLCHTCEYQVS